MNYSELLSDNTRADDYVNATALCKAFGKEFKAFMKLVSIKELIEKLDGASKKPHVRTKAGRTFETYVHPLIAIELASWLSVDFKVVVLETFQRYLEGDLTLAAELVGRSTDLAGVAQLKEVVDSKHKYLASYHTLTDTLKQRECTAMMYGSVNKHINKLVGVDKGQRQDMSARQEKLMTAAQLLAEVALEDNPEVLGWTAAKTAKVGANAIRPALASTPVYSFG